MPTPDRRVAAPTTADATASDAGRRCRSQPFAASLAIAEASGATYVPPSNRPAHLVVVGDSGTNGAFLAIDLTDGAVLERGSLPLDRRASDDLEGLSQFGDELVGVTSSGWLRHWQWTAQGYRLRRPAYPLSEVDEWRCRGRQTNCGPNYEGLCLVAWRDQPSDRCVGFVAAKRDGALYCLRLRTDGRLELDPDHAIPVAAPGSLSGCHFAPKGDLLWAGTNLLGHRAVYRIRGWQRPAETTIEPAGPLGPGFPEAIAVAPGGMIFRFSDTREAPSLVEKLICE